MEDIASECVMTSSETSEDKKVKKTRTRVKYIEIQQYSLDGALIGRFKNITEASKSGNYNHASISKCVAGKYKTAEGFRWVGLTEPGSDISDAA